MFYINRTLNSTNDARIKDLETVQREAINTMRPLLIEQDKEILRLNTMLDSLYGELGRMTFNQLLNMTNARG